MRRAARIDVNQSEIVQALRQAGCSVQILSGVGKGCPDLLVGFCGKNHLIEVKGSGAYLTIDESVWHTGWRGDVRVARSVSEAMCIVFDEWMVGK